MPQGEPELMQHLFGVPRMLDALRAHYGTAASPDAVQPAAGELMLQTGGPPRRLGSAVQHQC